MTSQGIRDLRQNLNEAQDFGQEAIVWWKRWNKIGKPEMADQVEFLARTAWSRGIAFLGHAERELQ